ncbi:hypothetical protein BC826DRAFT_973283 [Russula brevipes]|nr:hypothetical protein BC826DRAFT_973283 [Russula brevipes]
MSMSYRTNNIIAPTYDHALLSSVPGPTRATKPEEYDVGLLDKGRYRRAPHPPNGAPSDSNRPTTLGYSPGAAGNAHKEDSANGHEPVVKKVPWYRTWWGIGVIALIILSIVGGIVGGVVAGTHHSNKKTVSGQGQPWGQSQLPPETTFSPTTTTTTQEQQQQQGNGTTATPTASPLEA